MKPSPQTNQTDIDSSLVIKYLLTGIVIAFMLFLVVLIISEASHFVADSMKKITSYSFAVIMGGGMLFGVSRLFDPERKEREREDLFASIREAMKQEREIK